MMSGADLLSMRGYDALPIPFGWFGVAMSDEIAIGDVRTLKYFGTEFVVWRGENSVLNAVDPYCPHLGAHLGVGGEVVHITIGNSMVRAAWQKFPIRVV